MVSLKSLKKKMRSKWKFSRVLACVCLFPLFLSRTACLQEIRASDPEVVETEPVFLQETGPEEAADQELLEEKDLEAERFSGIIPDDFVVPHAAELPAPGGRKKARGSLPSRYDSREAGLVTEPKDQGDTQICWAYSAVSCAETSSILQDLDADPGFSERHLAYFFVAPAFHPSGMCGNDGTYYISSADDYLQGGGNNRYTTFAMADWTGIADRDVYPDDGSWEGDRSDLRSDARAADDRVHLENAAWIPMSDRQAVKQQIISLGSVSSACYSNNSLFYNSETHAYYNDRFTVTNHAVTLVGWDDDFPVENFLKPPKENGAWLAKNSVGTGFGEGGYYWISYEDLALSSAANTAYAFEFADAGNFDNIYFYDGSCGTRTRAVGNGGSFASVFTVGENEGNRDEMLEAVGAAFSESGITYTVQVYTDLKDPDDPGSGHPAGEPVTGTTRTAGYRTIRLTTPVKLICGSSFSVVITLEGPGDAVTMFVDRTYENGNWIGFRNETQKGQTFARDGSGRWTDLHEENCSARIKAFTRNLSTYTVKELRPGEEERKGLILETGRKKDIALTAILCNGASLPLDEVLSGGNTLEWTSSDPSAATVSETGRVRAVHAGDAVISAVLRQSQNTTSQGGGTDAGTGQATGAIAGAGQASGVDADTGTDSGNETIKARINVLVQTPLAKCKVTLSGKNFTYTGKAIRPAVLVKDGETTLTEGRDYTLSWSSNINTGTAKVTVTGCENHYTGSSSQNFYILPGAVPSFKADNIITGIRLIWQKAPGAAGYIIYRDNKRIATIRRPSTTRYQDKKALTNGAKYTYKIVATVDGRPSARTRSLTFCRLPRPVLSEVRRISNNKVTVKWKKNARVTGYQIQYGTDKNFARGIKTITISGASVTTKMLKGLARSRTFYIRVRTFKANGTSRNYSYWSPYRGIRIP